MKELEDNVPGIIFNFDDKMHEAQQAQLMAEIRNQAIRHAAMMAKHREWVKPEEIARRVLEQKKAAAAALERGKLMSGRELELIPVPDPLPKHMKGQSASTIQAMLRHERGLTEEVWKRDSPVKIKPLKSVFDDGF